MVEAEAGKDARRARLGRMSVNVGQAIRALLGSQYGNTSGMEPGSTTGTIKGLDGTTTRATAVLDGQGNRTVIIVDLD